MGRAYKIELTLGERKIGPFICRGTRTDAIALGTRLGIAHFGMQNFKPIRRFGMTTTEVQSFKKTSKTGGRKRG